MRPGPAAALAALIALAAGGAGCATVALQCPRSDLVCGRVRGHLETMRAHVDEPGNPEVANARMEVTRLGAPAVPYLVRALDDDEPGVAQFAARSLLEMGRSRDLERWCQGSSSNTGLFCGTSSGGAAR